MLEIILQFAFFGFAAGVGIAALVTPLALVFWLIDRGGNK
jgi:hypothetical protein